MTDVKALADGLSRAQARYLLLGEHAFNHVFLPPSNTHAVLIQRGLVERSGRLTATGFAVRAELARRQKEAPDAQ